MTLKSLIFDAKVLGFTTEGIAKLTDALSSQQIPCLVSSSSNLIHTHFKRGIPMSFPKNIERLIDFILATLRWMQQLCEHGWAKLKIWRSPFNSHDCDPDTVKVWIEIYASPDLTSWGMIRPTPILSGLIKIRRSEIRLVQRDETTAPVSILTLAGVECELVKTTSGDHLKAQGRPESKKQIPNLQKLGLSVCSGVTRPYPEMSQFIEGKHKIRK